MKKFTGSKLTSTDYCMVIHIYLVKFAIIYVVIISKIVPSRFPIILLTYYVLKFFDKNYCLI